jgi:hypothetical protein
MPCLGGIVDYKGPKPLVNSVSEGVTHTNFHADIQVVVEGLLFGLEGHFAVGTHVLVDANADASFAAVLGLVVFEAVFAVERADNAFCEVSHFFQAVIRLFSSSMVLMTPEA